MRPCRSIARPAGKAASAAVVRKIAGPRPRMPSIPVTTTSVTVATATTSWIVPERQTSAPERRSVFRRTGYALIGRPRSREQSTEAVPERGSAPVRGVADVGRAGDGLGKPADGDHVAAARDELEKPGGGLHLAARRPPIAYTGYRARVDGSGRRSRAARPPRARGRRAPGGRSSRSPLPARPRSAGARR